VSTQGGPEAGQSPPSEEEMRAAYEAELSRISATDMIAQAAVSLLNLGARRLAPDEPGGSEQAGTGDPGAQRDLEQARDAIDGARALLEILERRIPGELGPLRDALSRLQMAYAREVPPGAASDPAQSPHAGQQPPPQGGAQTPAGGAPAQEGGEASGPGPAESSGRLWVPGR
jgi:hypothetical protein